MFARFRRTFPPRHAEIRDVRQARGSHLEITHVSAARFAQLTGKPANPGSTQQARAQFHLVARGIL